jgi:hypothetical protein|tara:strand:- start:20 stop:1834 length:1815 start_codon:yes stop_codon:yes gene_type:complete
MQINEGESKMSNKDKKPRLNEKGAAKYFETAAGSMPSDQIYREVVVNAMESCEKAKKRDKNFKGIIKCGTDPNFPGKYTTADNGIGMKKDRMPDLIINLAETEEQSKNGNFGAGNKVAGFANNKHGMIYSSKHYSEDEGSRCRVYFNPEDNYAVKHYPEYNSCSVPLDLEELHPLIKEHKQGTAVTLCGNSENENTLLPPHNFFKGSLLGESRGGIHWNVCYLNTKFFEIPDFLNISVEVFRESEGPRWVPAHGHKYWLDFYSKDKGVMENSMAKFSWWILNPDERGDRRSRSEAFVNGHLAYMHKNEIIKIEYNRTGQKHPLKNWGLSFSYRDIVLIIEPKGFLINSARTTLHKNKIEYSEYTSSYKEYFMENMPESIKKYEAELESKHAKSLFDDDSLIKEARKFLKDIYASHPFGNELSIEVPMLGGMKLNINNESKHKKKTIIPGPNYGEDPVFSGIRNKKGSLLSKPATSNPLPQYYERDDLDKDIWVEYDWYKNHVFLNINCPLIEEYALRAQQINKSIDLKTYKQYAKAVLKEDLQFSIVMLRFKNTHLSEEKKKDLLDNDSLMLTLLNAKQIVERMLNKRKNLVKQENNFLKQKIA